MSLPLTTLNPELQARIDATPRGMMHWTATGPAGATCFHCDHFDQRKLRTKAERETPETVRGACSKYGRIMSARSGNGIRRRIFDPMTKACSHFEVGA
jgi:hypothetical protein